MITAIEIENFKGIGKRQRIEFAPITLMFGGNSAGKSTIAHAIHYAKEVLVNQNFDVHFVTSTGGALDLGGFESVLHRQSNAEVRRFSILLEFNCERDYQPNLFSNAGERCSGPSGVGDPLICNAPSILGIELTIGQTGKSKPPYLTDLKFSLDSELLAHLKSDDQEGRFKYVADFVTEHSVFKRKREEETLLTKLANRTGLEFGEASESTGTFPCTLEGGYNIIPSREKYIPWSSADENSSDEDRITSRFGQDLSDFLYQMLVDATQEAAQVLEAMCHIGPLRDTPARGIRHSALKQASWYRGMAAYYHLLNETEFQSGKDANGFDYYYVLDLKDKLDAPYQVKRKGVWISDESSWDDGNFRRAEQSHLELQLVDLRNNTPVDLSAVGSGISQVIPILVAASDQSLPVVFIEQPELHLHPRHQSNLADAIVNGFTGQFSNFVPDPKQETLEEFTGRCCILETHSEHLILRLQRRIRESSAGALGRYDLNSEDVVVIYVGVEDGETYYRTIELDKHGEFIQPWPDDFFDLDFNERFA